MLLWTIIIVLSVALDFLTKKLVAGGMELYERIPVIKGVFELEYIRNEGAAWGILSDHRWVFMAITAIAIVILPIILYKYRNLHFLFGFFRISASRRFRCFQGRGPPRMIYAHR